MILTADPHLNGSHTLYEAWLTKNLQSIGECSEVQIICKSGWENNQHVARTIQAARSLRKEIKYIQPQEINP